MLRLTDEDGALSFAVRVIARASRSEVAGVCDGALRVRVAAPPVAGAANEELRHTLARVLGVPARAVEITGGRRAKLKRVRVSGVLRGRLEALASG